MKVPLSRQRPIFSACGMNFPMPPGGWMSGRVPAVPRPGPWQGALSVPWLRIQTSGTNSHFNFNPQIMTLGELKSLLRLHSGAFFRIRLPDGSAVPVSFHVTEVGRIQKTFLDCGGTLRESVTCQLQVWVGEDFAHRIETGKMAAILEKARPYLPDDSMAVEVEYEDKVISQYTISSAETTEEAVVLNLSHKHTECLAPELCGLPAKPARAAGSRFAVEPLKTRCVPGGKCC